MNLTGQCRLCLNQAELQDSHFIPQAAYKRLRGEGKNPHPFVNDGRKAIQTAAQTRAHLLCHDCEQRLCKQGEDAFFRYCYHEPGKFKLLNVLREQKPMVENERWAAYVVPDSENSVVEQIGYLGLSILWKSAAHSWKDRGGTLPSIILGSQYQEQVRQYLFGGGPFLEHGAMVVEVSDENNRLISVVGTPTTFKHPTNHLHLIDLCGIRFNLLVGSRIPPQLKNLCVFRQGQKCRLVAKQQEAMLAKGYHEHLKVMAGGH
jgi:hypothetical protein